ncbi:hypothetical protein F2Q70_00027754 [Brassica cretica]|uniref:Uncharacterized protein n=1 Tax=Brassica cretica TaxID=69181 RepID=A0A8S9LB71_BRACR|nr:hypothetical protein F2Q70_00027754 [Brassica cretica]
MDEAILRLNLIASFFDLGSTASISSPPSLFSQPKTQVFSRIPDLASSLIACRRTTPSKQRGGMMRIGSIRPEYEFDDEDSIDLACFHLHEADVFVQWILAFFWIFKAFVQEIAYDHPTTFRRNSDGCKAVRQNTVGIFQYQTAIKRSYIFVGNGHMVHRKFVGKFRRNTDDAWRERKALHARAAAARPARLGSAWAWAWAWAWVLVEGLRPNKILFGPC